ncbi:hypothetical protein [Brevundimonas sp.]|uniref:hypothetical protein n=1 Tax=Brevundimonas sp. TaxID=1871086 RepID=UPI00391BE76E
MIATIEASALARWIGETALVYPVANTAHVIGAILLVGGIGLLDLRLLGYGRGISAPALERAVTPLALAGFAVMVISGSILFAADARALAGSSLFIAKLVLIALAGANAVAFRLGRPALALPATLSMRVMAAGSLILWIGVVILGRLIAYF